MGHIAYLGEGAPVEITGLLMVSASGGIVWHTAGAETAQIWVQTDTSPPQLVFQDPSGNQGVTWLSPASNYRFSLVAKSGEKQVELVAVQLNHPDPTSTSAIPAGGSRTIIMPWGPELAAKAEDTPPAKTPGVFDSIQDALKDLPGGSTVWLAGGGLALVLLLKRRAG